MSENKTLYQKFLETNKEKKEKQQIAKNMNKPEDIIVVKKLTTMGKLIEVISDAFYKLGKVIFWIIVCIVVTAGINALFEPETRQAIVSALKFIKK